MTHSGELNHNKEFCLLHTLRLDECENYSSNIFEILLYLCYFKEMGIYIAIHSRKLNQNKALCII